MKSLCKKGTNKAKHLSAERENVKMPSGLGICVPLRCSGFEQKLDFLIQVVFIPVYIKYILYVRCRTGEIQR